MTGFLLSRPITTALFLDEVAAPEEGQSAWRRAVVSAFSKAPAVADRRLVERRIIYERVDGSEVPEDEHRLQARHAEGPRF